MAVQVIQTEDRSFNRILSEEEVLIDVLCVPRAVELADPSTDGCGYRGKVKAVVQTVENSAPGNIKPSYINQYIVYGATENHPDLDDKSLMCPECGHELTPETSKSARTERRRNLKRVPDEVGS